MATNPDYMDNKIVLHLYIIREGTEASVEELNTDSDFSAGHPAGQCKGV